jgi:predicted nucleic acid-binding Zn ribbon protein
MYRAADLLKEVLARAGFDPQAPQARIYRTWDELLGPDLAGSARLRDIRRGRLEVEVDHPAWLQLVQMRQQEILLRVQRRFPELAVTRLHLVVGSRAAGDRDRPASTTPGGPGRPPSRHARIDRSEGGSVYSRD